MAGPVGWQTQRLALIVVLLCGLSWDVAPSFADDRPSNWAQPILLAGTPNFFKVCDRLYRSAQPSAQGMQNLRGMGIETIVNLRSFHSDRVRIGATGLGYEHLYMKAWHPEEKEVVRFLQLVANDRRTPILVHCQHGADRTGLMCAVYRIVVQGWSKDDAIQEMTDGGYGFSPIWKNLIGWVEDLDVERLRMLSGIEPPESDSAAKRIHVDPRSKIVKNQHRQEAADHRRH